MEQTNRRDTFLVEMYRQMWNNINRHLLVVWQSVSILGGSFAVAALVQKGMITVNMAATTILLVAAWQCANVIDSSAWYSRNLAILSRIEGEFLSKEDREVVHPYIGLIRKRFMPDHLAIQASFGIAVAILTLIYHFLYEVLPRFRGQNLTPLTWGDFLPYATFLVCAAGVAVYYRHRVSEYETTFKRDAPAPSSVGV